MLDYLFPTCQVSEKASHSPDCCAQLPLPFLAPFIYLSPWLCEWPWRECFLECSRAHLMGCQWSLDDLRSLVLTLLFPLLSHLQSIKYYSLFFFWKRMKCIVSWEWVPTPMVSFWESAYCYLQYLSSLLLCGCGRLPELTALGCKSLCPASGGRRVEKRGNKAISSVTLSTW